MGFPTSFPMTAIPTVIGFLRNTGVSRRSAAEAAYDLLGYGGHIALLEGQPHALFSREKEAAYDVLNDAFLAVKLEELNEDIKVHPNALFSLPPWVIPIALEILRRVLSS